MDKTGVMQDLFCFAALASSLLQAFCDSTTLKVESCVAPALCTEHVPCLATLADNSSELNCLKLQLNFKFPDGLKSSLFLSFFAGQIFLSDQWPG